MRRTALGLALGFLCIAVSASAQEPKLQELKTLKFNFNNEKKGAFFIIARFEYMRGSVQEFSYRVPTVSIGVEDQWQKNHFGLSGYEAEYRKESLKTLDFGHFLDLRLFRTMPWLDHWKIRWTVGAGFTLGIPSGFTDSTRQQYDRTGTLISYRRMFLQKNAWSPFETHENAILSPMVEVHLKYKPIPIEGGVRFQRLGFGVEEYDLANRTYTLKNQHLVTTSFFVRVHIKIK